MNIDDNKPVSIRFGSLKRRLNDHSHTLERSINWIVRKAVERYFDQVDNELNLIKSKKQKR